MSKAKTKAPVYEFTTFEIAMHDGRKTVWGWISDQIPGLGIQLGVRNRQSYARSFRITHLPTGRAVLTMPTITEAREAMSELAALADWTTVTDLNVKANDNLDGARDYVRAWIAKHGPFNDFIVVEDGAEDDSVIGTEPYKSMLKRVGLSYLNYSDYAGGPAIPAITKQEQTDLSARPLTYKPPPDFALKWTPAECATFSTRLKAFQSTYVAACHKMTREATCRYLLDRAREELKSATEWDGNMLAYIIEWYRIRVEGYENAATV